MLAVAGGILIAVLVLFLLPVILPLAVIVLAAVVALAAVALIVFTDAGKALLGVAVLAGAVFGAFRLWGAFQGERKQVRKQGDFRPTPKVGASDYLDWANREGAYAPEKQARFIQSPQNGDAKEYLLWANREGRYADASVSWQPQPRMEAMGRSFARFIRRWLSRF